MWHWGACQKRDQWQLFLGFPKMSCTLTGIYPVSYEVGKRNQPKSWRLRALENARRFDLRCMSAACNIDVCVGQDGRLEGCIFAFMQVTAAVVYLLCRWYKASYTKWK